MARHGTTPWDLTVPRNGIAPSTQSTPAHRTGGFSLQDSPPPPAGSVPATRWGVTAQREDAKNNMSHPGAVLPISRSQSSEISAPPAAGEPRDGREPRGWWGRGVGRRHGVRGGWREARGRNGTEATGGQVRGMEGRDGKRTRNGHEGETEETDTTGEHRRWTQGGDSGDWMRDSGLGYKGNRGDRWKENMRQTQKGT